jgi:hypothetical protein
VAELRTRAAAFALVVGAVLLSGCPAEVYYTQLLAPPHPLAPRRAEDVQVLVVTPPSAPHVDIGLFQVTSGVDATDSNAMVARLRAEAAARGCDAVLITSIDHQAPKDARPNVQGSCVVFDVPPVYAPPPAAAAGPGPAGAAAPSAPAPVLPKRAPGQP